MEQLEKFTGGEAFILYCKFVGKVILDLVDLLVTVYYAREIFEPIRKPFTTFCREENFLSSSFNICFFLVFVSSWSLWMDTLSIANYFTECTGCALYVPLAWVPPMCHFIRDKLQ